MKHFFRLLSYSMQYRSRFFTGLGIAFLVALLNGVSLTAFYPLFDALGDQGERFYIQLSKHERKLLQKAVLIHFYKVELPEQLTGQQLSDRDWKLYLIPEVPEKIREEQSKAVLDALKDPPASRFSAIDRFHLITIVKWKLKINESGYSPRMVIFTALTIVFPIYLLRLVFHLVSVRLIAGTGYMAIRDLRRDLYSRLHELPLNNFYKEKTGYLMSRIIHDVELVAAVISSNMRDAITNIFFILTHVLLLVYLNYKLLFISMLTVPIILSPVSLFSRKINKSTRRSQDLLAELSGVLQEDISGVRTVRSFAVEDWMTSKFRAKNERYTWRSFKELFYIRMGPNLVELMSSLVTIGIIALGAYFIDGVNFTGGEFFAFLLTLLFIIRPIIQLSGMFGKIAQAEAAGERIFELLDSKPDVVDPPAPRPLQKMNQGIEFRNVEFAYPGTDKKVLNGVSFSVKAGQTVALVGESGSGKSTMMDLMARFFDPTAGQILIDGVDIRESRIHDHRSRIGIVQQEVFLFHGTIRENITYGRPGYTVKDAERAARLASAHDFIERFPEGYETVVGERGVMLSGGQRQRISIARALLYNPEILILDEATSALDTESEQLVQKALDRLFRNRTTFVIAHRLSTIEKADLILVVSGGSIVDRGTHADLMQREGLYARLQQISREAMQDR